MVSLGTARLEFIIEVLSQADKSTLPVGGELRRETTRSLRKVNSLIPEKCKYYVPLMPCRYVNVIMYHDSSHHQLFKHFLILYCLIFFRKCSRKEYSTTEFFFKKSLGNEVVLVKSVLEKDLRK